MQARPELARFVQKNIPLALLALQNWFGKGKRLRDLCQDEMRVGLKTETGRVIPASGVKPVAQVEWQRDNFWLYGVVEPYSGWHFEQEYDQLNSEQFQSFLDVLSAALGDDICRDSTRSS